MSAIKRQIYEAWINGKVSKENYKEYYRELKREIEKSKRHLYADYIENSNNKSKATWDIVNELKGNIKKQHFNLKDFADSYSDSEDILNDINNYYVNSCRDVKTDSTLPIENICFNTKTCSLFLTDEMEVEDTILQLNNSKALGNDEVPISLLKKCVKNIVIPLVHIINLSFTTGEFPDGLKYTIIRPIHKKGDRSAISNYRPIALTSNISKVIEKVVYKRMLKFINISNILSNNQNGYIKNRSTTRAIFQLLEEITYGLNNKDLTVGIFMDLSKAFDCVHHEILLAKLERLGFRGVVLGWIRSYLSDRKQQVSSYQENGKEIKSEWRDVMYGVPQGSILGPLLFLLYINDLPDVVDNVVVLFADDSSSVVRAEIKENLSRRIEDNLTKLDKWFTSNNLKLNTNKTQLLMFNKSNENLNVKYKNKVLTCADVTTFLGLKVDAELSWRTHVDYLVSNLCSCCYSLRVVASEVGIAAAMSVYYANVNSRLQYGVIFWGYSVDAHRVFVAQKACVRAIFKLKSYESCKNVFKANKMLTLPSIYILEIAMFVKNNYRNFFAKYELSHVHNTRGVAHSYLLPPKTNLSKLQKGTVIHCLKIYNFIPDKIKQLPMTKFKHTLNQHLIHKTLYSVDEFFVEAFNV